MTFWQCLFIFPPKKIPFSYDRTLAINMSNIIFLITSVSNYTQLFQFYGFVNDLDIDSIAEIFICTEHFEPPIAQRFGFESRIGFTFGL